MTWTVPTDETAPRDRWLRSDPDLELGPVSGFVFDTNDLHYVPMHRHERAQLIHISRGVAVISSENMSWTLPPNRAIWLPSGTMHDVNYPHTAEMRSLFFDTSELHTELPTSVQVYHLDAVAQALLRDAASLAWGKTVGHIEQLTLELLFSRLRERQDNGLSLPAGEDARLRRAMRHMTENPRDNTTVDDLARVAHCSRRTLIRLFSRETGMAPAQWRRQMRLKLALEMLAADMPVSRVAWNLGYTSPGNFTVAFRAAFGVTPSRFYG